MKAYSCLMVIALLAACLWSCKKDSSPKNTGTNGTTGTTGATGTGSTTDTTKTTLKTDVYYVGFLNKNQTTGGNRAELWKNGVLTSLSNIISSASNIWVSKGNTYVCGYEGIAVSTHAVYWKNFNYSTPLTDGSEYRSIANDITVQDSDVLCVGDVIDHTGYKAVFWRNQKMTVLTNNGDASRILVKGSDIYIAGAYTDAKGNSFACYWKNGIVHKLSARAQATGIAIDDNSNIYVCGTQNNSPIYWKNDVMTALPKTTKLAFANAITTKGDDVYIVGSGEDDPYWGYNHAYCWKNGIPQDFSGGSEADDITIVGTHIFIAGSHAAGLNKYGRLWEDTLIAYLDPYGLTSVFNGLYIDQHY
ncbi:SBBP repeat-containing protein [Mucilaginibacter panaciglaebae]|uniref:Beta-propeller repeat-containing protein n=1 Tax=Mucilaginibacter panaciglaebae TaxID=502331 RepID=A0ABP7X157_9SPHI